MSKDIKAFPNQRFRQNNEDGCGLYVFDEGMTLRDYFAAKAMQGILSNWNYEQEGNSVFKPDAVSKRAYVMADAMLEAREK